MSIQQVNLYRPTGHGGHGLGLNLTTATIASCVLAVLLIALGVSNNSSNNQLASQLADNQDKLQQLQQQNQQLQQQLTANKVVDIDQQLQQKQSELAHLQQVRSLMQQQQGKKQHSFADQLNGLAQNHLAGISLQQIHLLNGGRYLALAGETQPAETLLRYVQKLQADHRFERARFGSLQLQRDQQRSGLIQFQLGDMPTGEQGRQP